MPSFGWIQFNWKNPVVLRRRNLIKLPSLYRNTNPIYWSAGFNTLVGEIERARAQAVKVTDDMLTIELIDGRIISVPLTWYPRLWYGTPSERAHFEIIGDGEYIHWPELDEDLSVSGMLAGRRSMENPESLKKWLAERQK